MQQNPWQVEQFRSIILLSTIITTLFQEQSGFVTEALRHLHAAQLAAADESRQTARQLSEQQQQALEKLTVAQAAANKVPIKSFSHLAFNSVGYFIFKAHAAAAAALANVHKV